MNIQMRVIGIILTALVITQVSCNTYRTRTGFNLPEAVRMGDIQRDSCMTIPLYQGNGHWGCAYGAFGLHIHPEEGDAFGKTEYIHLGHHVRAKFNADYLLPLAKIFWETLPETTDQYEQYQSFYDGIITTRFTTGKNMVKTTTWFDPVNKDLAGIIIELKGTASDVILQPFGKTGVHYNQVVEQISQIRKVDDSWRVDISCGEVVSSLYLKSNANVRREGGCLRLQLHEGKNEILISVGSPIEKSNRESLNGTIEWWNEKWMNMGCLLIPDSTAQRMWVRSMAMFLSSFTGDGAGLSPPCGLSGNGWTFYFPQDGSFVHAVLLATGNIDIAKSWIERLAADPDGLRAYTKRLFGVDGIFSPWVFPYGTIEGYHDPVPPNQFYYEIHNAGYLARMAYETALLVDDEAWTERYVVPLIEGTAEFYKNISRKEEDGLWHLFVTPSMGQDERGGENQKDYLCALYSAKYCFQRAVELKLDRDGSYREILENMAFPVLLSPQGLYYSCNCEGDANFGDQKHPVQLNPLTFLPVDTLLSDPSRIAYEKRYEITANAKEPLFHGWTLGTFLLAGSRCGNPEEWIKDWENLRISDNVDAEWIQIYESSSNYDMPFYISTNGLIAQSLLNNLISDWYGKLEIAKCNPWQGDIHLKNIYSKLGIVIDGVINGSSARLYLKAWKDAEFECNGEIIRLKKGEVLEKIIAAPHSDMPNGADPA